MARTLRDGERIVTRVAMNNSTLKLTGIIYVQAQLEAGDVEKVERRILEEITRLQQEGPTEEERELAVTKAESEHALAYETSDRSEEHTSELQSQSKLVRRLLLA